MTTASGQFEKGQSGNPTGKAKGTRNRVTLTMQELLEGEAERITRTHDGGPHEFGSARSGRRALPQIDPAQAPDGPTEWTQDLTHQFGDLVVWFSRPASLKFRHTCPPTSSRPSDSLASAPPTR